MSDFRYSKISFFIADFFLLLNVVDYFFNDSLLLLRSAISLVVLTSTIFSDDSNLKRPDPLKESLRYWKDFIHHGEIRARYGSKFLRQNKNWLR